jgi:hypothetical protein
MSLDLIEDALDLLDKDERPWLLVLGDGKKTRLFSNLGENNLDMLKGWVWEGHWNHMLEEHIRHIEEK